MEASALLSFFLRIYVYKGPLFNGAEPLFKSTKLKSIETLQLTSYFWFWYHWNESTLYAGIEEVNRFDQ